MPSTHITINSQNGESTTQTVSTPTAEMPPVHYTQRTPANLNRIFISKVSRSLSLDSSIPVMPSMNTSTLVPFAPVHELDTSSSISRSSSGTSSDLNSPGDHGHKGAEDKLPLHGGLKDPLWVTRTICSHQPNNGAMCLTCKNTGGKTLEKPERTPDFTVLNLYGPRRPAKRCKVGTISILTICFSVFVTVFILAYVIYCEGNKHQNTPMVHYKM